MKARTKTHSDFAMGIVCFNEGKFFAAHEFLEDVWREAPTHHKKFLQGLIQAAVAFHHYSTGNLTGARSVLDRSVRNLTAHAPSFAAIEIEPLLASLGEWQSALAGKASLPPLPVCVLRNVPVENSHTR